MIQCCCFLHIFHSSSCILWHSQFNFSFISCSRVYLYTLHLYFHLHLHLHKLSIVRSAILFPRHSSRIAKYLLDKRTVKRFVFTFLYYIIVYCILLKRYSSSIVTILIQSTNKWRKNTLFERWQKEEKQTIHIFHIWQRIEIYTITE